VKYLIMLLTLVGVAGLVGCGDDGGSDNKIRSRSQCYRDYRDSRDRDQCVRDSYRDEERRCEDRYDRQADVDRCIDDALRDYGRDSVSYSICDRYSGYEYEDCLRDVDYRYRDDPYSYNGGCDPVWGCAPDPFYMDPYMGYPGYWPMF
jgi:hypothetical protein